jgi:hypothetical protein
MTRNLDSIVDDKNSSGFRKLFNGIKSLYGEYVPEIRAYLASMAGLSIGVANWSKDFGYDHSVGLPFLYTNLAINGPMWYNLAMLQEGLTVATVAGLSKNKLKAAAYAFAYEAGSVLNAILYYSAFSNETVNNYYGRAWNTVFFFYQIPMFFMLLKQYFGAKKNKDGD